MKKRKYLLLQAFLLLLGIAVCYQLPLVNIDAEETEVEGDEDPEGKMYPGYFTQWFEQHKNDEGIIPSGLQAKWEAHDLKTLSYKKGDNPILTVTSMGPLLQGGRTRALLASSDDDNLLFAGAMSGGLWKSVNGGASWAPLNDAASTLAVSCITQSPFDARVIYYGTGESRANSAGVPGDGIFRSTDKGATFTQIPSTVDNAALDYIWTIEHSKTRNGTVYVGTNTGGVYVTTDTGTTWKQLGGTAGSVTDILCFQSGQMLIAQKGVGIFMSPTGDSGTFSFISSSAFPTSFQRIEVAHCRAYPNVVYAVFELLNSSVNAGVAAFCKSSDGGLTWKAMTKPAVDNTYDTYCMMLGVSPTDSNKVICGAESTKYTVNGATTWQSATQGHADNHVYADLNNSAGRFLLGSDGGVCRKQWDSLGSPITSLNNGYISTQYYGGDFSMVRNVCLGGLQDNGTWRIDGAAIGKVNGSDGGLAYVSKQNSDLAYVSTQNGAILKSENFTAATPTFTAITPSTTESKDFINFYTINNADGNQLYSRTSAGVWRSTDKGASWVKMNTLNIANVKTLLCTNKPNPELYIGGPYLFQRIDSAKTFGPGVPVNLTASLPNTDPMGTLSVHPTDPSTLFVGFTNYVSRPRAYKVIHADSSKPTWINISGDLPAQLSVNQIQADPADPQRIMYAATDFGLYFTTDSGHTWLKEVRVPNVVIYEIKLRAVDGKLFAFTHGRGVWMLELQPRPVSVAEKNAPEPAFTLYPVPASDKISIKFARETLSARISIYSSGGQRMDDLQIDARQELNISSLPPGIYYLEVELKNSRSVRKFVKM